jgi:hypothetical protein
MCGKVSGAHQLVKRAEEEEEEEQERKGTV